MSFLLFNNTNRCPQMHDSYKLYLVVKATNQAIQIKHELVVLMGRNDRLK